MPEQLREYHRFPCFQPESLLDTFAKRCTVCLKPNTRADPGDTRAERRTTIDSWRHLNFSRFLRSFDLNFDYFADGACGLD